MRLGLVLAVLAAASPASAAPIVATPCAARCERAPLELSKLKKAPFDFDVDTGWIPNGSPLQVRLQIGLHARTQVDMKGSLDTTWPEAVTLTPHGAERTGLLSIDDGVLLKAQARFTVTIAGKTYSWTGDIPGVPKVDLIGKASAPFDPWAWKGDKAPVQVSSTTPQVELYKLPLTDSIIPIPGIEGGFQLEGAAEFGASYVTTRIALDDKDATLAQPWSRLLLSSTPSFDTNLQVFGEVTRDTSLHFIPGFYFELLGQKFELELLDVPIKLPAGKPEEWVFDPADVHVPLPRVEVTPLAIDLGQVPVGETRTPALAIKDTGEERALVDVKELHFELPPGGSRMVEVPVVATAGPFETTVIVASNDPLAPEIAVRVRGVGTTDSGAGAPSGQTGGCACTFATSDARGAWLVVALSLLAVRRRLSSRA